MNKEKGQSTAYEQIKGTWEKKKKARGMGEKWGYVQCMNREKGHGRTEGMHSAWEEKRGMDTCNGVGSKKRKGAENSIWTEERAMKEKKERKGIGENTGYAQRMNKERAKGGKIGYAQSKDRKK